MERIRTQIYLVSSNETSDAKTTKFYTAALTTVQLNPRAQKEGEKDAMPLVDSDANDSIFEISHKKEKKKEKEIPIELHSRLPLRLHFFSINFFLFFLLPPALSSDSSSALMCVLAAPPQPYRVASSRLTYATPLLTTAKRPGLITTRHARCDNTCSFLRFIICPDLCDMSFVLHGGTAAPVPSSLLHLLILKDAAVSAGHRHHTCRAVRRPSPRPLTICTIWLSSCLSTNLSVPLSLPPVAAGPASPEPGNPNFHTTFNIWDSARIGNRTAVKSVPNTCADPPRK